MLLEDEVEVVKGMKEVLEVNEAAVNKVEVGEEEDLKYYVFGRWV